MVERTNLFTAAVVDELVGGALTGVLDNRAGHVLDGIAETRAALLTQSNEVGTKTANVGRSHGGTGEHSSAVSWLIRGNMHPGGEDIDYITKRLVSISQTVGPDILTCLSPVGEASLGVIFGRGSNSTDRWLRGRGVVLGIRLRDY